MKKFTAMILAAASLATLAAAGPAAAATHRHQEHAAQSSGVGQGYYEGSREIRVDGRDRASSPYAGGV
jgi:Spy/CpxP family protein refolding chaperone